MSTDSTDSKHSTDSSSSSSTTQTQTQLKGIFTVEKDIDFFVNVGGTKAAHCEGKLVMEPTGSNFLPTNWKVSFNANVKLLPESFDLVAPMVSSIYLQQKETRESPTESAPDLDKEGKAPMSQH